MGKGDKKTKKGKIFAGSFGVSRKKKTNNVAVIAKPKVKKETAKKADTKVAVETKKPVAKKVVTKKTTTKKTKK